MIRMRTGYSFREAYGSLEEYAQLILDAGCEYAPITDRANSYGWVRWDKIVSGFAKPVFGVELAVSPAPEAKRPIFDYWTFLGLDAVSLNDLIAQAWDQFRYRPLLTVGQAMEAGGVIPVIGRKTPLPSLQAHIEGRLAEGRETYVGVGPGVSMAFYGALRDMGAKPVLAGANLYPSPGDKVGWEIVAGRNASSQSWPQHWLSPMHIQEFLHVLNNWPADVVNDAHYHALRILEQSYQSMKIIRAELPAPSNAFDLKAMCVARAPALGIDLNDPVYRDRLDRELDLIARKEYDDYFRIVADICIWARERMLVGPARGSSCGSLVCFLLGITSIDPIPHGLIFERFVDINRDDMPDIDIDFPEHRREEVIEYIRDTYGHDHVSRLGTVALFRPRSALSEAGGALKVPSGLIAPVQDAVIKRSSGDARALDTLEDAMKAMDLGKELLAQYPEIQHAWGLEGHPRNSSSHASAVVLTKLPLEHHAPMNTRDGVLMLDKKDAEDLNVLKVDVLGLTQLSVIEYTLELVGGELTRDDLYNVDLNDPLAVEIMNKEHLSGIFQFNGLAVANLARQITFGDFNDFSSIVALARPGPIASGNSQRWIKHRNSGSTAAIHPVLQPMLGDTAGVVVYQEQVMRIGREIGGLSWGDVTQLRKAMSKSLGKEYFDQYGDRWKPGAIAAGIPEDMANKLWDDLCAYGSWSFNKSHAVAYGVISFWCAYIKARFPLEFAAATLSYETDIERQRIMLRELAKEGYGYVPFDPDISVEKWTVDRVKGVVVGPLGNIRGIGPKTAQMVIGSRARGEVLSPAIRKKLEAGKTELDSLYPVSDAYARLVPNPGALNIVSSPISINDAIQKARKEGESEIMVVATLERIIPRDANEDINIARRGGKRIPDGEPTALLNLRLRDDSGRLVAMVTRWRYAKIGDPIVQRGNPNKVLYALRGQITILGGEFPFFNIERVKYLGALDS